MVIPEASKHFRWGTQKRRLYDRLTCGPVTSAEIVRDLHIYGYHKIISEIRRKLHGTGVTVKARPTEGRSRPWEFRLGVTLP